MGKAPKPAPHITDEHAQALYEYWLQVRGAALVPSRDAFDPAELFDLLPRLRLLDRRVDGSCRWRLMATAQALHVGRDLSGRGFDPASLSRYDGRFLVVCTAAGSQPCGAVIRCLAQTTGGRSASLEILLLPLQGEGGGKVLVYTEILDLACAELRERLAFLDLKIAGFEFFDIGAGVPPGDVLARSSVPATDQSAQG